MPGDCSEYFRNAPGAPSGDAFYWFKNAKAETQLEVHQFKNIANKILNGIEK